MSPLGEIEIEIRSFERRDQAACLVLYRDGLLGGTLAANDSGLDIDDIDAAYQRASGNHFWVATLPAGEVVGMIGVQHNEDGVGEIRRLRVQKDYRRRGIGSKLVEQALRWCESQNYLKITLDTFMDREPAIKMFEKFRFRHHRTREMNGRELLYFYLDIYQGGQRKAD